MTLKEKIIEILKTNENLTGFELSKKIGKNRDIIRNALNSLQKDGIIEEVKGIFKQDPSTKSNRGYKVYRLNKQASKDNKINSLLKQLYELMSDKMDFTNTLGQEDIELIKQIKEMV